MTAKELLETAKKGVDNPDLANMGREDVRCILWLISTGKVNTITEAELQAQMDKNAQQRATRL